MKEKISIIIPVYNVEAYLDKCVKSVIDQTYENLEIILVDDGSPDQCPKICDKWAEADDRIVVIHKENGGLSDARNAGLDAATGEYISFIDSDDYVSDDYIEKLYNALIQNGADISAANYAKVNETGALCAKLPDESVINAVYTGKEILYGKFARNSPGTAVVIACVKLYKKKIFAQYRFAKGRLNEDEFAFFPIYMSAQKVVCVEDVVYFYLQRSDSIMGQRISEKRIRDNFACWEERLELCRHDRVLYKKVAAGLGSWIFVSALPNLDKDTELTKILVKQYRKYIGIGIFDKHIELPAVHKLIYFVSLLNPYFFAKWKQKLVG